jgi:hypothetical protein
MLGMSYSNNSEVPAGYALHWLYTDVKRLYIMSSLGNGNTMSDSVHLPIDLYLRSSTAS